MQNWQRGATLLELIVVVAIIGIFSAVTAVTYPQAEDRRKAALAAQQIAADLRFAQSQALSFKKHGSVFARGGYGIRFANGSSVYEIFADLECEGATGCSPSTPLLAADGSLDGPSLFSLKAQAVSWDPDEWLGGDVLIVAGACAGNVKYIPTNSSDELYFDTPFTHPDGTDCIPEGPSGDQSQFIIFGNGQFDGGQELVETRQLDGVTVSAPSSLYNIVFTPPKPEVKVNRGLHSGSVPLTVTVSAGPAEKIIDIYANGFIEIR